MADVKGFRAFRYNPEKIQNFDKVITPPFDVISPEERAELANRSPYNYVHLILPEARHAESKYESAAVDLQKWIEENVLVRDGEDSIYVLEQTFTGLDGKEHVRRAFFATARIPEHDERSVLGHERTFHYKVEDRLALTEAVQANTGAVFVLYDDPNKDLANLYNVIDERKPDMEAHTIDGVHQRVWRQPFDPAYAEFFRDKTLYIADGHHRYRTAWTYRDQRRQQDDPQGPQPYDYVLFGFVALQDPGLIVYPAHRVVDAPQGFDRETFLKNLEPWFEVEAADAGIIDAVKAEPNCAFGFVTKDSRYLLRLRDIDRAEFLGTEFGPAWRELDVSVLHGGILERVLGLPQEAEFIYEKDPERAIDLVKKGGKDLAFIQRNMNPHQICACADAGEYMPQKATYFYPKLCSGAVINPLK